MRPPRAELRKLNRSAAHAAGRALPVLGVFAAVGVLAAVLTRGAVGTMAGSAGPAATLAVCAVVAVTIFRRA